MSEKGIKPEVPTADFEASSRVPSLEYPRDDQADEDGREEQEQLDCHDISFRLRFRAEQKIPF
jgi:hypothetical protein